MEGPSLYLAEEQLQPFKGHVILAVTGKTTKVNLDLFKGKTVKNLFAWGKYLIFQFDDFAIRIHFMLFGTFSAEVEGVSVTGDYKKGRVPRLAFIFPNGEIEMYNCSVLFLPDAQVKQNYDFTRDIMSKEWDTRTALKTIRSYPADDIADALLDQAIFAGVGNIIKNEVLSLTFVNPQQKIADIPAIKLQEIITTTQVFSQQFYTWRKTFVLKKNLKIHQKGICPHCGGKVTHEKTGKQQRMSHYCMVCQAFN